MAKRATRNQYGRRLSVGAVFALMLATLASRSSPADAMGRTGGARIGRELDATPGVWISPAELARLPMRGPAWERLKAQADAPAGVPDLSDQNQMNNVYVLAKALVYARTKQEKYRAEVIDQCMMAIDTERGGRTLALGRKLAAYVIAADLVALPPEKDEIFRAWLRRTLAEELSGRTLRSTHETRPNNWGTHAGASRAAVAVYLGDASEIERTAQVFKGWLGDRSAYTGFKFGDLSWQCHSARPVGINPSGCRKQGHSVDGVLPDDQRRSGRFTWPPPHENYVYEALQGAIVQAVILRRAGYDTFDWGERAILRAFRWLYNEAGFPATGDDTWELPLLDYFYGTSFWDGSDTRCGKNMGWTEWTHSMGGVSKQDSSLPLRQGSRLPTSAPLRSTLWEAEILGGVRTKIL